MQTRLNFMAGEQSDREFNLQLQSPFGSSIAPREFDTFHEK